MNRKVIMPYVPREAFEPFHDRKQRSAVLVAHRRAGKTVACVNDLIGRALSENKENGRYAYLSPYYTQSKDIAWEYLKQFSEPVWGERPNESELRVTLANGSQIRLYGADNYHRMRGIYLDGIVLDEPAQMRPGVYGEVIRPALADRKGWSVFIGTPMGHNHFYDLWAYARKNQDDWFALMLKASETGILDEGELAAARREMTPAQYEQEFECSFEAAILGAYWGQDIAKASEDGRITRVAHDPSLPVDTWWDLGHSDATAVWFVQHAFNEIHVIDYYEVNGASPQVLVSKLNEIKSDRGFNYGRHIWPHDGGAKTLASGGRPLSALFSDLGLTTEVQPRHDIQVGISRVRQILPRCWFDEERCHYGLEVLRNYRAEFDEDKRVFKPKPLHDWASHGADAFRTGAMASEESHAVKTARRRRYDAEARGGRSSWAA